MSLGLFQLQINPSRRDQLFFSAPSFHRMLLESEGKKTLKAGAFGITSPFAPPSPSVAVEAERSQPANLPWQRTAPRPYSHSGGSSTLAGAGMPLGNGPSLPTDSATEAFFLTPYSQSLTPVSPLTPKLPRATFEL